MMHPKIIPHVTINGARRLGPIEMNHLHFGAPGSAVPAAGSVRPGSAGEGPSGASAEIRP